MADETVNQTAHDSAAATPASASCAASGTEPSASGNAFFTGPSTTASRRYQFQAFRWRDPGVDAALYQGFAVAPFVERAQDIAVGARTVLELLEWDALEQALEGEARTQVLPPTTVGNLRRLAITSLAMLGADAERLLEWMGDTQARAH